MVRIAKIEDLESIVEIYNQAIDAGFQTAFTQRYNTEDKVAWFYEHPEHLYPLLVYEQHGKVVGYLHVSSYRQGRAALRFAVEISYFIHRDFHRKGIGSQLLEQGIKMCGDLKYRTLLAIIMEPNIASAKLLEKYGFEKWGYLPDVADYNGVTCSQVYYGRKLG